MLELTGIASVLRGIGFLYWLLAIGLLVLAIRKGKDWRSKTLWALPVVCVFSYLPATQYIEQSKREAFAKEAWAYFKSKCDTLSGKKIYKTFTGVKSVLVVKPLPPATETNLYDQYWYGDPYSDSTPWDRRGEQAAIRLASINAPITPTQSGRGFDFVESLVPSLGTEKKYVKYFFVDKSEKRQMESIVQPVSRYGLSWEDISKPEDRIFWVAGSRLKVLDLTDNSVIAERIGFYIEDGFGSNAGQRRPWLASKRPQTTCPPTDDSFEDRLFVLKVLNPNEESKNGK